MNSKIFFAGGCFWCTEAIFRKVKGVEKVLPGYIGGHLKNPTYEDVVYTDSGHVEAVEITYDPKVVAYKKLLNIYWQNIVRKKFCCVKFSKLTNEKWSRGFN